MPAKLVTYNSQNYAGTLGFGLPVTGGQANEQFNGQYFTTYRK